MTRIRLTRRQAIGSTAAAAGALALPYYSRAASRPVPTHGVQSGDVAADGAMVWTRADRPARMLVEWSTTEDFSDARRLPGLALTEATDHTGKMLLTGLPGDQEIFCRLQAADLQDTDALSEPVTGHFRSAPAGRRDVGFVWSGDTAGQGWGIDEDRGGMKTYATMLNHRPDFFIHSGDTIYADGPLSETQEMPDGGTWRNLVTEEKAKVAETLHEFRHNWFRSPRSICAWARWRAECPMRQDRAVQQAPHWQREAARRLLFEREATVRSVSGTAGSPTGAATGRTPAP